MFSSLYNFFKNKRVLILGLGREGRSTLEILKRIPCTIGISDDYVEHGNVDVLRKEVGLDRESIVKKVIADDQRIKEEK